MGRWQRRQRYMPEKSPTILQNSGVAEIKMESGQLKPGDRVYIQGPTTGSIELTLPEIHVDLKAVEKTVKGERCSISVDIFLRKADKVYKIVAI